MSHRQGFAGCRLSLVIGFAAALAAGRLMAQGYPAPMPPPQMGGSGFPAERPIGAMPGIASGQPGGPPVVAAQDQPRQLVMEVEITGNETIKNYEIEKHIQTRKERDFDPELVQADVRRLVQTGKFRDVKTFTRQVPGGVVVIYEVFERPRVNYIRHLGNRGMSEKKLGKEHGLKVGDPLNSFTSEEARRKVEELYRKEGFPNATVTLLEGDRKEDKGIIFVINEGQLERISRVSFQGNTIASDGRLKTQIESKPGYFWYLFGGKVDRQKIEADVEKLTIYYRGLGYMQARIGRELEFDENGKWLTLKFIIDEGIRFRVREVTVDGNTKFATRPLMEMMKLKSGDYFNQAYMNRDLSLITDLYGSQGHVFADVQADPRFLEEPGQIAVAYRVKEGDVFKVGDINVNIAGEFPHTRQTVVLNRTGLRPGDIIDTRERENWERRLKAAQLFTTDPAQGEPPRVAIRPPSLDSFEVAPRPKGPRSRGTVRGQSPDEPALAPSPWPAAPPLNSPFVPPSQSAANPSWSPYRSP